MSNVIFCDEAGITGNNLLDEQQPHFVFASINIDPDAAKDVVAQTIRDYRLKGNELKGSQLIKRSSGRKAIISLIDRFTGRARLAFYNKKYSLAGKFYQYTFDDVLADAGGILYALDFNRFIANAIYVGLVAQHPLATAAITDFQSLMRKESVETTPKRIFSPTGGDTVANLIETIILFCQLHKNRILRELNPILAEQSEAKWLLELTYTSLYDLLSHWGSRYDSIEVYCDESKPISDQLEDFDRWVGNQDKIEINLGRGKGRIGFNLAQPICLVDSHSNAGIQIADVLASALCYSLNNQSDPYCQELFHQFEPLTGERCVFPDFDEIDLRELKPYINSAVLWQLVDRSCRGKSVEAFCEALPEFIVEARASYAEYRASIPKEVLEFRFPGH